MLQPLQRKIDCVVRVVTPENIEFEYMVAGPFQRLPAFLIDLAVRCSIFAFVIIFFSVIGIPLGSGTLTVVFTFGLLAFFLLSWVYGTYMETRFNGRTVGKMALRLRVISADGRPINGTQAALRNMLRLCDFMPPLTLTLLIPDAPAANAIPTCLVALVTMTLTHRMQRIGDIAANTMVVWEGRKGYNTNLQPEDPRAYALSELIPPTFQVSRTLAKAVALYMERRIYLSMMRREEIASNLAKPLLEMFELRPDTSADLLLCAIYVRIYQSEDQRLAKIQAAKRVGQLPNDQAARIGYQPVKPTVALPPKPVAAVPKSPMTNPYDDEPMVLLAEVVPDQPLAPPLTAAPAAPTQPPLNPSQSNLTQPIEATVLTPPIQTPQRPAGPPTRGQPPGGAQP